MAPEAASQQQQTVYDSQNKMHYFVRSLQPPSVPQLPQVSSQALPPAGSWPSHHSLCAAYMEDGTGVNVSDFLCARLCSRSSECSSKQLHCSSQQPYEGATTNRTLRHREDTTQGLVTGGGKPALNPRRPLGSLHPRPGSAAFVRTENEPDSGTASCSTLRTRCAAFVFNELWGLGMHFSINTKSTMSTWSVNDYSWKAWSLF